MKMPSLKFSEIILYICRMESAIIKSPISPLTAHHSFKGDMNGSR